MTTGVSAELETATDNLIPITLCQMRKVITVNTIFDETKKDTGVEVVACADSAHSLNRLYGIVLRQALTIQLNPLCSAAIY
jgi:hypothetical protein